MTTLAADAQRITEVGDVQEYPMIAADIIYEGATVGLVPASGYAEPLASTDKFVGFAERRADNSSGVAAAKTVRVRGRGEVQLAVAGAVITDVGQPVYATDDNAFGFTPVGGVFVGFVQRFVSAGVVIVSYDIFNYIDPYAGWVHVALEASTTLDATYTGKWIWCATDAQVFTLPAVEGINFIRIGNMAAYGVSGLAVSPNAADMIEGPGITAADNKDIINTKATARRGDWIEIAQGDANGWSARFKGTWAREA